MVIDKKEHKEFLLQLIEQSQYPGNLIDLVYEVKKAIEAAEVKKAKT